MIAQQLISIVLGYFFTIILINLMIRYSKVCLRFFFVTQ
jgi:hypothetical protein